MLALLVQHAQQYFVVFTAVALQADDGLIQQLELISLQGCLDERVHFLVAILADFLVYDRVMQMHFITPGRTRHFTGQVGT